MSVTSSFLRIGEAAKDLGVSTQTLRNWDKSGRLRPRRSSGRQRLYERDEIERAKYNFRELGLAWAISAQASDIPDSCYCERSDRFTSRLDKISVDLLAKLGDQSLVSLLTLLVGEIGDNSFTHNLGNWPDVPGVFFAYDLYHRYIVLADRGRGIRATLQPIRPTRTDTEALKVAFTEIVSGRSPEKRGNGLKVVRRVVEKQAGISLYLRSGLGIVKIQGGQGKMQTSDANQNLRGVYAVITF